MHKYQPRFHIIRCSELQRIWTQKWKTFHFPEMEFIAVTAYQNEKVSVSDCERLSSLMLAPLSEYEGLETGIPFSVCKSSFKPGYSSDHTAQNQSQPICQGLSRYGLWQARETVIFRIIIEKT